MTAPAMAWLDRLTTLAGVRGVALVARADGLVIAESLQEGVDGEAVAALVASLAARVAEVSAAAGRPAPRLLQVRGDVGSVLAAGLDEDQLLVVVTAPGANVGAVRLALLGAAGPGA